MKSCKKEEGTDEINIVRVKSCKKEEGELASPKQKHRESECLISKTIQKYFPPFDFTVYNIIR